jgi:SAM-dependent methyltransferase
VVGVDCSPRSIALARAEVPAAAFIRGDFAHLGFAPASFDGVIAAFSLIHVPRDEHAGTLQAIAGWLRPGGVLVVTMGIHEHAEDWGEFFGTPMFWSSWGRTTNVGLVGGAGLEVLSARDETEPEDGVPFTHLWVTARRPSVS